MTTIALDDVCRRLGLEPAELGPVVDLPDVAVDRLAALIAAAIDDRDQQLRASVDASLGGIPRPLRRVVRKVVGG